MKAFQKSIRPNMRRARGARPALPRITLLIVALTAGVTLSQIWFPGVLAALRRDPVAFWHGEYWRALSPLLVHADGAVPFLSNLVGIAVIGAFVETRLGAGGVLSLYLLGGAVGELAGSLWQPDGAGASVALFGLIGGGAVLFLRQSERSPGLAGLLSAGLVAAVTGQALGGPLAGAALLVLVCAPLGYWQRARPASRVIARAVALFLLAAGVVLAALANLHGPPLLAGALLGRVWARPGR